MLKQRATASYNDNNNMTFATANDGFVSYPKR